MSLPPAFMVSFLLRLSVSILIYHYDKRIYNISANIGVIKWYKKAEGSIFSIFSRGRYMLLGFLANAGHGFYLLGLNFYLRLARLALGLDNGVGGVFASVGATDVYRRAFLLGYGVEL